jgi:hypothetical protein
MLINLNLMRNNEIVKFLNFQILKKNPSLLFYIKHKIRKSLKPEDPIESEHLKCIDKAIQVLQEDP